MLKNTRIKRYITAILSLFMLLLFLIANPLWLPEYRAQDAAFQHPGLPHPEIKIIAIDDHTLAEFGQFHLWSRERMAEAINILNRYEYARPSVIGIDILYSEAGIPEVDKALVEAVANAGNVVMASTARLMFDHGGNDPTPTLIRHQLPFPDLIPYVEHGLINAPIDRDGVIRSALLRVITQVPNFPHIHHPEFIVGRVEQQTLYSFPTVIAMQHLNQTIPSTFIRENERMHINYTGMPNDFFEMSFADIFSPYFDPVALEDSIVLIGAYAMGMMDHHLVPIGGNTAMFGVEIHANVIQQILEGAYKQRIPDRLFTTMLILCILVGMALGELLDIRIFLIIILVMGGGYIFAVFRLYDRGFVLPILTPPLILSIAFFYHLTYSYILQARERTRLRSVFKKYIDPQLVDVFINEVGSDLEDFGRRKHISVVFVDIRGFTPMSEYLRDQPETTAKILNEYLDLTSASVFINGGSVDKFIGDATMALFNGFVPLEDHVYQAVKAAWDMMRGASILNASIKEQYGIDIGFGIGVHCGDALVGNLGPSFRKDYTAIGDTVNTAARLESTAKRSQVLISADVYILLKNRIEAESIGMIPLKGKSESLEIFSLTKVK
ncbi:MAG: adenylate/guanylate cyclase domain-containing protein [Defluviitaleaceae bacterium]|nr:adenylate/guanylate cyclase domain-containing protein [Defluviitaleaceae bacterium]